MDFQEEEHERISNEIIDKNEALKFAEEVAQSGEGGIHSREVYENGRLELRKLVQNKDALEQAIREMKRIKALGGDPEVKNSVQEQVSK